MTLIPGPWKPRDDPDDDVARDLPIIMPGRAPKGASKEVVGPVFEGVIVDEPDEHPALPALPVEVPAGATGWQPPVRRPVIEPWVRDRQEIRSRSRHRVEYAAGIVAFHLARLPLYVWRAVAASPRGLLRSVAGAGRWVSSAEFAAASRAAQGDRASLLLAEAMRSKRANQRSFLLLLSVIPVAVVIWLAPGWLRWLLLVSAVAVLGVIGRRSAEKPIISHAVDRPKVPQLTAPIVMRALTVAGLGGKKKGDKDDSDHPVAGTPILVRGPTRDGKGFAVVVDLPYGRTSKQAVKRQEEIASGLDVGAVQLFLDLDPSSERRLGMWVADRDPYMGKPHPSPLAKCPKTSVWEPHRLGVEPRGPEVKVPLIFNGFLVGSVPRQGKTFTVRNLVAAAVLDPYCDITVLGAKSSDWEDIEQVAVNYCAGEGDDAMVEYAVAALRKLLAEAQVQYDAIRALPKADRPEGKVTPELQARGFRPHVIVVEECQNIFGHRDETGTKASKLAKEALYLCTALAKVAPAAGFILVLATQRPSTEVIPADLRDVLSVRIALKVNDRVSSDTILGDYRSARGIESASLINEVHRGVATLVGLDNGRGGDHTRVRCDLLTAEEFGRVCQVGRQRRLDAHTLRGHAAGEVDPIAVEVSLLDDLLAIWPDGETSAWSETLCERLGNLRPDLYGGWEPTQLASALTPYRLATKQLAKRGSGGDRANRRGLELAAVEKAAERRATR